MILCDYGSCSGEVKEAVEAADTEEADHSEKFKRFNDQMYVYLGAAPTTITSTWSALHPPAAAASMLKPPVGAVGGAAEHVRYPPFLFSANNKMAIFAVRQRYRFSLQYILKALVLFSLIL